MLTVVLLSVPMTYNTVLRNAGGLKDDRMYEDPNESVGVKGIAVEWQGAGCNPITTMSALECTPTEATANRTTQGYTVI